MQFYNPTNQIGTILPTNEIAKSDAYNCKCKSATHKTIKSENYQTITFETDKNTNSYSFLYIAEGGGSYHSSNVSQEIKVGHIAIIKSGEKVEFTPTIGKQTSYFHISVVCIQYTLFLEKIDLFQN